MTKAKPIFDTIMKQSAGGLHLAPILNSYLYQAKYPPSFSVDFVKHESHRAPDNWFHPSTHPLWEARQLYYYIAEPDRFIAEPLEYMGALSTTMGTAIHGFIQMCLKDTGVLIDDEVAVVDDVLLSRGHMDGILQLPGVGRTGFEFKTSGSFKANTLVDNDVEVFKTKFPVYYAQVQEYMRISGLRKFVVLFMLMGYPWTTKEIMVDYDIMAAETIASKYRLVRQAVADGVPPDPCCAPRSKTAKACGARGVCPIGLM